MVLGDGEVRFEDVGGVFGEGGVVGVEVDVVVVGYEVVIVGDILGVFFFVVDDVEYVLVVLGLVELLFFFYVVGFEFYLFEFVEFGELGLGLVDDDEIGVLEGVFGGDDIEIGFLGENVVVERILGVKVDMSVKVGLVFVVGGRLEIVGSVDFNFDGVVNVESIVEEVVVVINGGDGVGMESRVFDGGNVGEIVGVVIVVIFVMGNGVFGVRFEEVDILGVDIGDIVGGVGDV